MATYKVIQDIEAEDKLVGPLSLRQFIYAGVGAFCVYLSVIVIIKHAAFLAALFAPPALFCFFFAWPWTPDQPTEVWALARIRFYFKPRRRIWDQSGVKELVTITVPKKIERVYTNGLSQTEVKSRLTALADTIDSRGWVIKNANVNLSTSQPYGGVADGSDRLVSYDALPQEVPNVDVLASDDILDEQNNPVAHQFAEMISASEQAHRSQLVQQLNNPAPPAAPQAQPDYWFLHQPSGPAPAPASDPASVMFADPRVILPGAAPAASLPPQTATPPLDETALAEELKEQHQAQSAPYGHLRTVLPPGQAPPTAPPAAQTMPPAPVPTTSDAAILNLANNNDLNVATLAREAQKEVNKARAADSPDHEVVVSLH